MNIAYARGMRGLMLSFADDSDIKILYVDAILGLCQSLEVQHKTDRLEEYKNKYMQSFSHAEQIPPGSIYVN